MVYHDKRRTKEYYKKEVILLYIYKGNITNNCNSQTEIILVSDNIKSPDFSSFFLGY